MTLSRKSSRPISIDGQSFRWTISPDRKKITLIVEAADGKGQRLEVSIASDINQYWTEFPQTDGLNLNIVTPTDVATIINLALRRGWTPGKKGTLLRFEFKDGQLEMSNGN